MTSATLDTATPAAPHQSRGSNLGIRIVAAAILLWSVGLLWMSIGDHPLYSPDEGRYARTSQLMAETGDWLVPTIDGEPRLQKPPLIHWLQAPLIKLMGSSELAVRAPSSFFTSMTTLLVLLTGWKLRDLATGVIAATLLLIMPLNVVVGRLCIIDPMLAFFFNAALFAGYLAFPGPNRTGLHAARRRWFAVFWIALTLGVFAKGPVGLLPAAALLVWAIISRQHRRFAWWSWPVGLAVAAAPVLTWALAAAITHPQAWTLWWREIVSRTLGTGDHVEPIYYYLPVLLAGMFPATALLPVPGVHYTRGQAYQSIRSGSLTAYCAVAVLVPLVFLSLMGGKLASYLMPLCAPVALVAAWGLRDWLAMNDPGHPIPCREQCPVRPPNGIGSIATVITGAWFGLVLLVNTPSLFAMTKFHPMIHQSLWQVATVLVLMPILAWIGYALWRRPGARVAALLVLALCANLGWSYCFEWGEDRLTQPFGNRLLLDKLGQIDDAGRGLFLTTMGYRDQSLSFYADQHVLRNDRPEKLHRPTEDHRRWVILSGNERWEKLLRRAPDFAARFDRWGEWDRSRDKLSIMVERAEESAK